MKALISPITIPKLTKLAGSRQVLRQRVIISANQEHSVATRKQVDIVE